MVDQVIATRCARPGAGDSHALAAIAGCPASAGVKSRPRICFKWKERSPSASWQHPSCSCCTAADSDTSRTPAAPESNGYRLDPLDRSFDSISGSNLDVTTPATNARTQTLPKFSRLGGSWCDKNSSAPSATTICRTTRAAKDIALDTDSETTSLRSLGDTSKVPRAFAITRSLNFAENPTVDASPTNPCMNPTAPAMIVDASGLTALA
jgi:hypothetical protein